METGLVQQSTMKFSSEQKFSNAIISEIELKNGKQTQAVVIFNNCEVDFEEMNAGLNTTLSNCMNVRKSKNTFCSIKDGVLKPFARFFETVWNE
ncbi:hypothetical protein FACS1894203_0320 [Bacteroidia bacterium]|nr:hypothetical protein FACS1894203_0320 [Bacteroidia bacterium]